MIERAFETGVLDRRVHQRLAADLESFAVRAGIPPEAICKPLSEYVGRVEETWVREVLKNRKNPSPGFCYVGNWRDVQRRMAGMCGAFVRNFINARVLTVDRFIEERPTTSVVLIPNFHPGLMPGWKVAQLTDAFMERAGTKSTVITVGSFEALREDYGSAVADALHEFDWQAP